MEEIRIVHAYLDTLAGNARVASTMMAERSGLAQLEFSGNPGVQGGFNDLLGRWDRHRATLSEGIGATADAFEAVRDAFAATEHELVGALDGGGD